MSNAKRGKNWYESATTITRSGKQWYFAGRLQEYSKSERMRKTAELRSRSTHYRVLTNMDGDLELWVSKKGVAVENL